MLITEKSQVHVDFDLTQITQHGRHAVLLRAMQRGTAEARNKGLTDKVNLKEYADKYKDITVALAEMERKHIEDASKIKSVITSQHHIDQINETVQYCLKYEDLTERDAILLGILNDKLKPSEEIEDKKDICTLILQY